MSLNKFWPRSETCSKPVQAEKLTFLSCCFRCRTVSSTLRLWTLSALRTKVFVPFTQGVVLLLIQSNACSSPLSAFPFLCISLSFPHGRNLTWGFFLCSVLRFWLETRITPSLPLLFCAETRGTDTERVIHVYL